MLRIWRKCPCRWKMCLLCLIQAGIFVAASSCSKSACNVDGESCRSGLRAAHRVTKPVVGYCASWEHGWAQIVAHILIPTLQISHAHRHQGLWRSKVDGFCCTKYRRLWAGFSYLHLHLHLHLIYPRGVPCVGSWPRVSPLFCHRNFLRIPTVYSASPSWACPGL